MPISVYCPACNGAFTASEKHIGKPAKCPKCGERFTIKGPESPPVAVRQHATPPPVPQGQGSLDWDALPEAVTPPQVNDGYTHVLVGLQGKSVHIKGGTVVITKEGWLLSSKREKTLPIRNISSVEVKQPGVMVRGFIQFSIAGGAARNSSFTWTGGTFDAAGDENSVLFGGDDAYRTALAIKRYVESYGERAAAAGPGAAVSVADELMKLKGLMDEGILSREEFDEQKRRLLNS